MTSTRAPGRHASRARASTGLAVVTGCIAAALATPAIAAAQDAPPPLPGPPPGAGLDLPGPPGAPSAGSSTPVPVTIDPNAPGPGLMSGTAPLKRGTRRVVIALSCQANGSARLEAPVVARGTLASAPFSCASGRAEAALKLSRRSVKRVKRLRSVLAAVTLRQGAATVRLSLVIRARAGGAVKPAGFWTDGQLQCSTEGQPQGYLVAPNWTATPATAISARPWIAWYNEATGWRWVGSRGPGLSSWSSWTATPQGVAQWFQPTNLPGVFSLQPWSFGPLSVPVGSGTFVVGVFETVYWWGGRPTWVWNYVRSSSNGLDPSGAYCRF
jgi:hypothetical protein